MTETRLQAMIAALKDKCEQAMAPHKDGVGLVCAVDPMSSEQSLSLSALMAYAAHRTGRSEYRVERDLSNHFHVPNPKCLSQSQYDDAIRYIADQVPLYP